MFGCSSEASICRSLRKRRAMVSVLRPLRITLTATFCSNCAVVAHCGEDCAHAAASHLAYDAITPDTPAFEARAFSKRVGRKRRMVEHSCAVGGEHPLDLAPGGGVGTDRVEKSALRGRCKLDRCVEDSFDLLPGFGGHFQGHRFEGWVYVSCAASHALALRHSRLTVDSDVERTSATSSFERPAKNFISTMRACTLSSVARRVESFVEQDQINLAPIGEAGGFVEREHGRAGAALLRAPADGVVDEDAAHRLGGDGEEMRAVAPVNRVLVDKAQVCFVDERGGLQRVSGPLARKLARSNPLQLEIDERQQLIERRAVARLRLPEQPCHLFTHLPPRFRAFTLCSPTLLSGIA